MDKQMKIYIFGNGNISFSDFEKYYAQILNQYIGINGYKTVALRKKNSNDIKQKNYLVHRLLALTFIENKNNYHIVDHIDGNKLNNNLSNLHWSSYSKNVKN